jgi:hypothetical protein
MIAPNELRIGNWVNYTGITSSNYPSGIIQVEEVLYDGANRTQGDSTLYECDLLQPIPLTPEILEKCGFEKKVKKEQATIMIREDGSEVKAWVEIVSYQHKRMRLMFNNNKFTTNCVEVVHLHQLQNLYHALTGDELNVLL